MTTRHGPLSAIDGSVAALAVGDVPLRHVRFTTAGVAWHRGGQRLLFVPWSDVERISIDPAKSWWPHPAVGDWVMPVIEGVFGAGGEVREPATFFARVVTTDAADEALWELDGHYFSGYRRRDARATARLVDLVSADPQSRALLARPADVVDRVSSILRTVR